MASRGDSFVRNGNASPFPHKKNGASPDLIIIGTRAFDVCAISDLMEEAHLRGLHSRFLCTFFGFERLKNEIREARFVLLIAECDVGHEAEILKVASNTPNLGIGLIGRDDAAIAPHKHHVEAGRIVCVHDFSVPAASVIDSLMD